MEQNHLVARVLQGNLKALVSSRPTRETVTKMLASLGSSGLNFSGEENKGEISSEFPKASLIDLGNGRSLIPQTLIARQSPPIESITKCGGEIFRSGDGDIPEPDDSKIQCFLGENGIWYWNTKARKWLANIWYHKLGGRIETQPSLTKILQNYKDKTDTEIMKSLGIVDGGWFNQVVYNEGSGVMSSSDAAYDGGILAKWLFTNPSTYERPGHDNMFGDQVGLLPFITIKTPES